MSVQESPHPNTHTLSDPIHPFYHQQLLACWNQSIQKITNCFISVFSIICCSYLNIELFYLKTCYILEGLNRTVFSSPSSKQHHYHNPILAPIHFIKMLILAHEVPYLTNIKLKPWFFCWMFSYIYCDLRMCLDRLMNSQLRNNTLSL